MRLKASSAKKINLNFFKLRKETNDQRDIFKCSLSTYNHLRSEEIISAVTNSLSSLQKAPKTFSQVNQN